MTTTGWLRDFLESNLDDPGYLTAHAVGSINRQIYDRMYELGITQKELARRTGFRPAYLSRQLNHGRNMTIKTLIRLAYALDARVEEIKLSPTHRSVRLVDQAKGRLERAPLLPFQFQLSGSVLSLPEAPQPQIPERYPDEPNFSAAA